MLPIWLIVLIECASNEQGYTLIYLKRLYIKIKGERRFGKKIKNFAAKS